jgi:hypothetical protein
MAKFDMHKSPSLFGLTFVRRRRTAPTAYEMQEAKALLHRMRKTPQQTDDIG